MVETVVVRDPFDAHLHCRQGPMLQGVVPLTAATFAGALVMPNTRPPVRTREQLFRYRDEILGASAGVFLPALTLYFTPGVTEHELGPEVTAVKFYPRGLTHGSDQGCSPDDPGVNETLAALEAAGVPLCVHPESPGYHEDREWLFRGVVERWVCDFPRLRIVLEHLSDRRSIPLVVHHANVHATVTPHHLLLTGDDWVGPPLRCHRYCAPVCKRPEDREALQRLVLRSEPAVARKVFLGTDSAPHEVVAKECADACPGIFTAPIALPLVAQIFEGREDRIQGFASDYARDFYRLDLPARTVTLVREPFLVPHHYRGVVPLYAGTRIPWRVEEVVS